MSSSIKKRCKNEVRKTYMRRIIVVLLIAVIFRGYFAEAKEGGPDMKINSPEFENNKFIPAKFTCQGEDINPALVIEGIPRGAKSLALIMDDPDAPMGTWVHWVVYDIPIILRIDENSIPGKQGINNFGRENYGGPCPPSGTHRYFFKIYALDKELGLDEGVDKQALEKAMQGHILDKTELVGLYKKSR
jgi:Raf kinase inhibitor-like YbhB/YbcL family protein